MVKATAALPQRSRVSRDPVAARLNSAGEDHSASTLEWLDRQHRRRSMRRRAAFCIFGSWLLLVTAAVVSSVVAIYLSSQIRLILQGDLVGISKRPLMVNYLPGILITVTLVLIIGGVIAWAAQRVPGFSRTSSAIDWSAASDAVTRLLTAGCTYPEAFRTAAKVATSKPSHQWLMEAARRVESGGPEVIEASRVGGDTAVVELMVNAAGSRAQSRWKIVGDHFFVVAERRLVLLLQTVPMIATILSGLIVWLAISSSIGWMWQVVAQLMQGLTY